MCEKQYFAECVFGVQIVEYTRLRENTNVNDAQRIFSWMTLSSIDFDISTGKESVRCR